jgi:two-component system NtrC family sensor kinase
MVNLHGMEFLADQDNLNAMFKSISQQNSGIVDLHVINAAGEQIAYVGPYAKELAGKNYYEAGWFREVMIKGSSVSDVFLGFRSIPHFVIAIAGPLRTHVLRATINSEEFNQLLVSSQIGPHGDSFIVNPAGVLQTPSQQGQKELTAEDREHFQPHEGTSFSNNNATIIATKWILDGQWCIFVKTKVEDALAVFKEHRLNIIGFMVATSVIFITLMALMAKYFLSRIEIYDRRKSELSSQMVQMEKMATVGRLAAGIAHEINNPLQMITNQAGWIADLLKDEDPQTIQNFDEYEKSAEQIKMHVRRAGTITHRLLSFSRKISPEHRLVSLNELIDETLSFVEADARHNNINIVRNYQEDLPATQTDGAQLQQVFLNLINNAMDAINHDGNLLINTSLRDSTTFKLEFSDNGPGIKPEVLKRIFDPFYTTKEPGKGTGLGLSICYDIITKLGGNITAGNNVNGGALFTITLPLESIN